MRRSLRLFAIVALLVTFAVTFGACRHDDEGPMWVPNAWMSPGPEPEARPGERVLAVGFPSLILQSPDGGATWGTTHRGAVADGDLPILWDAAFADRLHGWAVGRGGVILATSDGGKTWLSQHAERDMSLVAVTAVDGEHAWAVGHLLDEPVVLATQDGGLSWHEQRVQGVEGVNGVAFSDRLHGWITGLSQEWASGSVYATTDGGKHWQVKWRQHLTYLGDVACTDAGHVWVVGGPTQSPVDPTAAPAEGRPPLIIATTDGGRHWRTQLVSGPNADMELADVCFADTKHGTPGRRRDVRWRADLDAAAPARRTTESGRRIVPRRQAWLARREQAGLVGHVRRRSDLDSPDPAAPRRPPDGGSGLLAFRPASSASADRCLSHAPLSPRKATS